jgi:hypothetical protein
MAKHQTRNRKTNIRRTRKYKKGGARTSMNVSSDVPTRRSDRKRTLTLKGKEYAQAKKTTARKTTTAKIPLAKKLASIQKGKDTKAMKKKQKAMDKTLRAMDAMIRKTKKEYSKKPIQEEPSPELESLFSKLTTTEDPADALAEMMGKTTLRRNPTPIGGASAP